MKARDGMSFRNALPLPAFVLHPLTALVSGISLRQESKA
jgi:hypothetical protein